MRKKIKILHKKLGKDKVWGLADIDDYCIVIDERAVGKKHLEIVIHECLHLLHPSADESSITHQAISLTDVLWKLKYRRVDDSNHIPLQDGKK
jgi:hypothetical protein